MSESRTSDLTHSLGLPTLLFAALGGMTWAVRGSSGYGGVSGCIFGGVMWGAAWWFLAREPGRDRARRYSSAWIVLAVTAGVGYAGNRGWMQWPSFFEGKLQTDFAKGEFVPIARSYGFLWLFIAGVPWAGLGACLLAWCGSAKETRVCHWMLRVACGVGGACLARFLYDRNPQFFLPMYGELEARYLDLEANPNLRRLINDCGHAIFHLGYYLGFLSYEVLRRDWKNVVLILTVGLVNGAGWAACQNWKWAAEVWPDARFNFWRCWESSGGISIGVAYGVAYYLVNRPMPEAERAVVRSRRSLAGPNFEWLLVYGGLTAYLHQFLQFQFRPPVWGHLCFAAALMFGGLYYHFQRGRSYAASEESPEEPRTIDAAAAAFVLALVAGLFFDGRKQAFAAALYPAAVVALGYVWYRWRQPHYDAERARNTPSSGDVNLERLGLWFGLLAGLGISVVCGLKGWFNVYLGNENYWLGVLWTIFGPAYLAAVVLLGAAILYRPRPRDFRGELFPHAYGAIWLVLLVQNVLGQLVTGPPSNWNEVVFNIYYLLLFFITATILCHYHVLQQSQANSEPAARQS